MTLPPVVGGDILAHLGCHETGLCRVSDQRTCVGDQFALQEVPAILLCCLVFLLASSAPCSLRTHASFGIALAGPSLSTPENAFSIELSGDAFGRHTDVVVCAFGNQSVFMTLIPRLGLLASGIVSRNSKMVQKKCCIGSPFQYGRVDS